MHFVQHAQPAVGATLLQWLLTTSSASSGSTTHKIQIIVSLNKIEISKKVEESSMVMY